jgi:hypothetical protein
MRTTPMTADEKLNLRIQELKAEKQRLEDGLREHLAPGTLARNFIGQVFHDKRVHADLLTLGLSSGAALVTDQIFGKKRSIKGFLSSILVQRVTNEIIIKHMPNILSGISLILDKVVEVSQKNNTESEPQPEIIPEPPVHSEN